MPATSTVTWVTPRTEAPPGQPDIDYAPDHDKWQARAARRVAAGGLQDKVPEGFPDELTGDLVWDGNVLAESYDWTYVLNQEQLAEIDRALAHFKCMSFNQPHSCLPLTQSSQIALNLTIPHVTQETFPLPKLHSELRRLSDELHNGHGLFVIRGLQVDKHTREENVIIYTGISAHIASQRGRQDHKFEGKPADVVLTHITDLSRSSANSEIGSPAYTTDKQVFHTDSGDIVSLFALETALEGGASKLASTWKVYNEIAKTRPDLIHTLADDWDYEMYALVLMNSSQLRLT